LRPSDVEYLWNGYVWVQAREPTNTDAATSMVTARSGYRLRPMRGIAFPGMNASKVGTASGIVN
ncbi:MAG TPA: hypothetical protein VLT13_09700, partial [Bacteroidota bacterium]|nr:hypothetical protein [Bacteroidota bacterium]